MINEGKNPYFVMELETGYVVMGDHQHFKGYTLFLCKEHVTELHYLSRDFKLKYLEEMSIVAEAVYNVFKPEKMNYELLGNGDTHVHWHLFPRVAGDTPEKGPVWWLPRDEMWNDSKRPEANELKVMVDKLKEEINSLTRNDIQIIDVKVIGGAIYSNGKILFSGYAEDKNGIWNYDINTKKLVKQIDVSDGSLFNFSLNPTKDKIMMTGGSYEEENIKFTMNLASINENLELSNLTSVVSSKNKNGIKSLAGWSDDGNEFYLYTSMQRYKDVIGPMEISYEIYKIK